jgi:hypothetical protein
VTGRVSVALGGSACVWADDDRGVRLRGQGSRDTSELRVDHVVAATGFRIDRIDYLDPALAKSIAREIDGIPRSTRAMRPRRRDYP